MDPILPFKELVIATAHRCFSPKDMDMLSDMTTVNYQKRAIQSHIRRLEAEIKVLLTQTNEEYTAARHAHFEAVRRELAEADDKRKEAGAPLEQLITEVEAWEPPTKDHDYVKQRLLEDLKMQLEQSRPLNYKLGPVTVEPDERQQELADAFHELREEHQSLIKLNADIRGRNQWWLDLAESIGYTTQDLPLLTEV